LIAVLVVGDVTKDCSPAPGHKIFATSQPIEIATSVLVINKIDNFRPELLGISAVKKVWRMARKISGVDRVRKALRISVLGNSKWLITSRSKIGFPAPKSTPTITATIRAATICKYNGILFVICLQI